MWYGLLQSTFFYCELVWLWRGLKFKHIILIIILYLFTALCIHSRRHHSMLSAGGQYKSRLSTPGTEVFFRWTAACISFRCWASALLWEQADIWHPWLVMGDTCRFAFYDGPWSCLRSGAFSEKLSWGWCDQTGMTPDILLFCIRAETFKRYMIFSTTYYVFFTSTIEI